MPEKPPKSTNPAEILNYIRPSPETVTHDRYWANFIYSAVKLVELRGRNEDGISPQPGDILSFILYWPPYEARQKVDWDASPYNLKYRPNHWVARHRPYDPKYRRSEQQIPRPQPNVPVFSSLPPSWTGFPIYSSEEQEINLEIMMRETGETDDQGLPLPNGGFPKRPMYDREYLDRILNVPLRLASGSRGADTAPVVGVPPLSRVRIKLMMARDLNEILDYVGTGVWAGERRPNYLEVGVTVQPPLKALNHYTWTSYEPPGIIHPDWAADGAVDRTRTKIRQLDYFGHAGPEMLYLQYGWANAKGELTGPEKFLEAADLINAWDPSIFIAGVRIKVWGCHSGQVFAPQLAAAFGSVWASTHYVDYEHILDEEQNLPRPTGTPGWELFA
ncbi:hypothetical protein PS9374_04570 [Planomonospora sphaerica]|uniref:Uncharacterized protein n=1 Tax=Planomonospora sphaerica TaxID=161355 RepID=A0A161LN19_9ACTN|nr:hypothetical protein PS9374_04570 [Planomonospora sphaerica]